MGIHVIRSEHSYRSSGWWTPAASVRRHWRARGVSDFIAVSHYIARQTRRDFLVSSRRITTIYNGTDLQRFQPGNAMDATSARRDLGLDAGPVVSMVAHLHHAKRQLLLLEAMKVIWKRDPRVQLVLAGGGPDESMLRAASSAAGGPVKLFTGNNDVAQIYHASDLAVLPSTGEGLPGSAIEALACGVPVVVTAAGGLGEVPTHGVSGLIVDGATPESLGAAIEALLGDERLRTWMSGEARKRAIEVFDIRRTARETLEFYSTRSPRD
jgi:glycosyltransferase involved in cell wall biosynthesis